MADGSVISQGRFLHLGQVVVDFSLMIDHLPERGGDIFASRSSVSAGGGYNVLYAARKVGARAVYAGAIGDGPMAEIACSSLAQIGVEAVGARIEGVDTGISVAMTEPNGERTFVSTRGAETMVPHDFYENLEVSDSDVVYLSGYSFSHADNRTAIERFAKKYAGGKGAALVDGGPMVADMSDESIEAITLLHPIWSVNERESAILAKRFGIAEKTAETGDFATECKALALAVKSKFLLRAGSQGAWFYDGSSRKEDDEVLAIPTLRVKPVDTNGAGDAHSGALCAALLAGYSLEESLKLANCAGALSTEHYGPATCPSMSELVEAAAAL